MEEIQRVGSLRIDSAWTGGSDAFSKSVREESDEEALKWAALEKLPTYSRLRTGILTGADGQHVAVDVRGLGVEEKQKLLNKLVRVAEEDNESFLLKLRDRIDR